jgi:Protein of unknown function (DUF664)
MDDALRVVVEMHESLWGRLKHALEDLSEEERHWRPLPHANTINIIIRHLRIEAQWHLDSLEYGAQMPTIAVAASQEAIDGGAGGFRGEHHTVGGTLYPVCGDAADGDAGDATTADGSRLRRREAAHIFTRVSPGHLSGGALWPDPHDSQPVLQDARRAGALLSGQPHVSALAVDHRSMAAMGLAIPAAGQSAWCRLNNTRCTGRLTAPVSFIVTL